MADGEDWELLQLYVRDGSHAAFAQLAAKYARFVHAIAFRRTRDPHLAEDVTQAVLIVLARRAESLPRAVSIAGWLHRTTVYTAVSAMRSENRRRHHEHVAASYAQQEWGDYSDADGAAAALDADDLSQLDEAIHSLPLRDREVLALHFFEGCRVREVGVRLGISREAAAKRLARAVRRLKQAVAGKESGVVVSAMLLATLAKVPESAAATAGIGGASSVAGAVGAASVRAFDLARHMVQTLRLLALRKVAAAVLIMALAVALPLIVIRRSSPGMRDANCPPAGQSPRVTLVSEGDYFLEKNLGAFADMQRLAPESYPPTDEAHDRDAVAIFDGFTPKEIPGGGRYIWINTVPPGRGVRISGAAGLSNLATFSRAVGWRGGHPILKDLDLSQLRIAGQLRLDLPPHAQVLVEGSQGPLVVLDRDEHSCHLIIAFSPRESTWPLHSSFGQFLRQAVDYMAQQPLHADATEPAMDSLDALAANCPAVKLAEVPLQQRRGAPVLAAVLVIR